MAGKRGSTRRGKKASTSRRSRQGAGEEGGFSLGHCTTTEHTAAATGEEGGFSLGRCSTTKPKAAAERATGSRAPCTTTEHMVVEEAGTGEKGTSLLRPSATAKPVAAEEPATDEEGLLKGCSTKRKSSGESEASGIFPEQEFPTEHWAYTLYNPAAPTVNSKLRDRLAVQPVADLFSEDAELRKRVKSVLLRFPESYALGAKEFEQAIDRIIKESKPETASVAAPGMDRLEDDVISVLLIMVKTPTVDELLGVEAGRVFPPCWINERKKYLDEQCQPEKKTIGHNIVLVDKVRVDLLTKGYVEVHEDYMEENPDFDPYVHEGRVRPDYDPEDFAPSDYEGEVMLLSEEA